MRIGVVGFCMGGTVALITAVERGGAAVTFYGGGVTEGRFGFPPLVDLAPRLRAPWLGLYGDLDQGISVDQVEALRAAAATAATKIEVVRYADAGHGFHCDQRASFHAASRATVAADARLVRSLSPEVVTAAVGFNRVHVRLDEPFLPNVAARGSMRRSADAESASRPAPMSPSPSGRGG